MMVSYSNRKYSAPLPISIFTALTTESTPIITLTEPFIEDWGPMTSFPRTHGKQALETLLLDLT